MSRKIKRTGLQFFAMQNLDDLQERRNQILQRMAEATRDNDAEAFSAAFSELAEAIQERLSGEIRELRSSQDAAVLSARGCRTLTSVERKFYEGVMEAMRSGAPQQALAGVNTVLPETVIDAVFEDLRTNHPLLSIINFRNTGALVKLLLSTTGGTAVWGPLGQKVNSELSANFVEVNLTLAQLTAFIPVPLYMLDLGPQWLDRYVRELLAEAIVVQLETGVVDGTGKDQPIGMARKLTGDSGGVYPSKDAIEVTSLDPTAYGGLLDKLTQGPNGKRRAVNSVLLVVNPGDYFTKVFPATTVRAADGTFNSNVFPFPTTVVQSVAVPAGKAVIGLPGLYFMGLGTQSGGKIEYSDHYQFLERNRVYMTYLYGYGRAMDENAFLLLDISKLEPGALRVAIVADESKS